MTHLCNPTELTSSIEDGIRLFVSLIRPNRTLHEIISIGYSSSLVELHKNNFSHIHVATSLTLIDVYRPYDLVAGINKQFQNLLSTCPPFSRAISDLLNIGGHTAPTPLSGYKEFTSSGVFSFLCNHCLKMSREDYEVFTTRNDLRALVLQSDDTPSQHPRHSIL